MDEEKVMVLGSRLASFRSSLVRSLEEAVPKNLLIGAFKSAQELGFSEEAVFIKEIFDDLSWVPDPTFEERKEISLKIEGFVESFSGKLEGVMRSVFEISFKSAEALEIVEKLLGGGGEGLRVLPELLGKIGFHLKILGFHETSEEVAELKGRIGYGEEGDKLAYYYLFDFLRRVPFDMLGRIIRRAEDGEIEFPRGIDSWLLLGLFLSRLMHLKGEEDFPWILYNVSFTVKLTEKTGFSGEDFGKNFARLRDIQKSYNTSGKTLPRETPSSVRSVLPMVTRDIENFYKKLEKDKPDKKAEALILGDNCGKMLEILRRLKEGRTRENLGMIPLLLKDTIKLMESLRISPRMIEKIALLERSLAPRKPQLEAFLTKHEERERISEEVFQIFAKTLGFLKI
ncbi:MAG: hypothetical protein Q6362_003025 [Candidatus Wukongarchaeota archaeon]|nr:hypothetical protein [Candidatus Wukongarchaeota archaeon]